MLSICLIFKFLVFYSLILLIVCMCVLYCAGNMLQTQSGACVLGMFRLKQKEIQNYKVGYSRLFIIFNIIGPYFFEVYIVITRPYLSPLVPVCCVTSSYFLLVRPTVGFACIKYSAYVTYTADKFMHFAGCNMYTTCNTLFVPYERRTMQNNGCIQYILT